MYTYGMDDKVIAVSKKMFIKKNRTTGGVPHIGGGPQTNWWGNLT